MSEFAVEFDRISKKFRRGQIHDSLRDMIPSLARTLVRGHGRVQLGRQEFWALKDVSFRVGWGEAVGIIGHNGAGKSTILKIITGVMHPTAGKKTVNGSLSSLIEVGAGFHPDLTGRENIFLNGTILGMSRADIRARMEEIIEFSGLRDFINTPVKRYSSGMYARLGFAIACYVNPDILVVDEVLSVGDWAFQNRSMEKMQSILKGGATVVFVSHNLKAMTNLCDRVFLLEKGEIIASGRPGEVVDSYIKRAAVLEQEAPALDKEAVIETVSLRNIDGETSLFRSGDRAMVVVKIANRQCASPVAVAVGLRDESYNLFFYIDSARLVPQPLRLGPGESRTLNFELDMHLAPGSYFLNVALTQPDLDRVLDHRAPAKSFVVHSEVDVRGVANLYPRVRIT